MDLTPIAPTDVELSIPDEALRAQGLVLVDPAPVIEHVSRRFGFSAGLFDDLLFLRASHKIIRATTRPLELPIAPEIDRTGIDFLRIDMANPRMTTSAMMTWGHQATTNVIDTDREQCLNYLCRQPILLNEEQLRRCTGRGFVIIRHLGQGLGVGFLESTRREDDNFARTRSMYPRAFSQELEQTTPFGNPS